MGSILSLITLALSKNRVSSKVKGVTQVIGNVFSIAVGLIYVFIFMVEADAAYSESSLKAGGLAVVSFLAGIVFIASGIASHLPDKQN